MLQSTIEKGKLNSTIGEVCERKQGGRGEEQEQETSDWKSQLGAGSSMGWERPQIIDMFLAPL